MKLDERKVRLLVARLVVGWVEKKAGTSVVSMVDYLDASKVGSKERKSLQVTALTTVETMDSSTACLMVESSVGKSAELKVLPKDHQTVEYLAVRWVRW